jgi:predicted RNA-binding protein YlxR (DUF448 family)
MMMNASVPSRREPRRTCVGCGKQAAPRALVRLVLGVDGHVVVDAAGGGFGRGAHVHASPDCLARACRSGLSRAFATKVVADEAELRTAIREAYERRAVGMLLGARRAGYLALGADAAEDALTAGAPLVVVAGDAGAVVRRFERAVAEGRGASFGTKAGLGELFGTGETAVFAVRHQGVASALHAVLSIATSVGNSDPRGEAAEQTTSRRDRGAGER